MTLDEIDKKAGELFKLLTDDLGNDPRTKNERQVIMSGLSLVVELLCDIKRIENQFDNLNKALCVLIDLKSQEYQNGILVKIQNPLEVDSTEAEENIAEAVRETFGGGKYIEKETDEKSTPDDGV